MKSQSTAANVLRGLRTFGPEHFAHLEALIAERDELLAAARLGLTALDVRISADSNPPTDDDRAGYEALCKVVANADGE